MILEKIGNYTYVLKNCRTVFENFSGRKTRYNKEGDRNFCVRIDDPAIAQELMNDGFYISKLNKLDEDSPDEWKLKISIGYKPTQNNDVSPKDPKIKEIIGGTPVELTRHSINALDDMRIEKAIVEFNKWNYDKTDPTKFSAWLQRGKFWVIDDWFTEDESFTNASGMIPDVELDEENIPF